MAMPVAKAGLAPGSTVWVPDPDSIFAKATVVTVGLEHVTVTKSPEQEAAADEEAEEEDTTFAISREVGLEACLRVSARRESVDPNHAR